jgi:hypothetical protein
LARPPQQTALLLAAGARAALLLRAEQTRLLLTAGARAALLLRAEQTRLLLTCDCDRWRCEQHR